MLLLEANPFGPFLLFFLAMVFYWMPTIAAYNNKHNNRSAIAATNFFLGWTVIGWIVAFIWACTDNREANKKAASSGG